MESVIQSHQNKYISVPDLRNRADGVNLSDEWAVGLKEEEKLEMQLVKPLTQLQLLEDMRTTSNLTATSTSGIDVSIEEQATCSNAHVHRDKILSKSLQAVLYGVINS